MTTMPDHVRTAIERLMVDHCYNVDSLTDIDRLLAIFTPDAVTDMSAIGVPVMPDRAALRVFYEGVFGALSHSFHAISNFRPESWDGAVGVMTAYVIGAGHGRDGSSVTMHVRYRMECIAAADGWQCRRYTVTPMLPLAG